MIDRRIEEFENENGVSMVRITVVEIDESGNETVVGVIEKGKPSDEPVEPEPTQLDRIEATVNGIAENGTNYNEMAAAITEGVNDV